MVIDRRAGANLYLLCQVAPLNSAMAGRPVAVVAGRWPARDTCPSIFDLGTIAQMGT